MQEYTKKQNTAIQEYSEAQIRKTYNHDFKIFAIFAVLLNFSSINELSHRLKVSGSMIYSLISQIFVT
jgi:hypothetical protein